MQIQIDPSLMAWAYSDKNVLFTIRKQEEEESAEKRLRSFI